MESATDFYNRVFCDDRIVGGYIYEIEARDAEHAAALARSEERVRELEKIIKQAVEFSGLDCTNDGVIFEHEFPEWTNVFTAAQISEMMPELYSYLADIRGFNLAAIKEVKG